VVCATKRNLKELIQLGTFREDLYYRINTVLIALPPLRARKEDIAPLADAFLRELSRDRGGKSSPSLSGPALASLFAHDWPGNVRELRHALEHAVAFVQDGTIEPRHLPSHLQPSKEPCLLELHLDACDVVQFQEVVRDCERQLIEWALARAGGKQGKAAELLSIPRTTLRGRIKALRTGYAAPDTSEFPGV
jgi:transcriptional regulator with PAS, ATPase and Fis domain